MSAIELRNVVKRYGSTVALDDFSLDIAEGEFLTVVGPTSCGKSTVLRLIAGLDGVTAGDVLFDGEFVNRLPTRDRNVAMVSQEFALYPHLTVYENLAFPLRQTKELKGAALDVRVRQVSGLLDLDAKLQTRPSALAGGERQRVALGRAIVREAGVLLFDEPLSNVDAAMRPGMIRELRRLHERFGVTTVYVTHDQMDALRLGDRVAVLDGGRLQQVGTPRELLDDPANTCVGGFVGSPPMTFFPARMIGGLVHLPFGLIRLPPERLSRVPVGETFLAGVRPEYADDSMPLSPADDNLIQITEESMAVARELADFELDVAGVAGRRLGGGSVSPLVASLRAEGLMPPGRDDRVFVDTRRIHLFDPATGENLTRRWR
jgi:multiple sugar transport system ATP-binding protein